MTETSAIGIAEKIFWFKWNFDKGPVRTSDKGGRVCEEVVFAERDKMGVDFDEHLSEGMVPLKDFIDFTLMLEISELHFFLFLLFFLTVYIFFLNNHRSQSYKRWIIVKSNCAKRWVQHYPQEEETSRSMNQFHAMNQFQLFPALQHF